MMELLLLFALFSPTGDAGSPPAAAKPGVGDDTGRMMRKRVLSTTPSELGFKPGKEFPSLYGVVMDWPLDDYVVTVVSFSSGDASIYTTTQFGVIGGAGHEPVRAAAIRLIRETTPLVKDAKAALDRAYPSAGKIRFFLLTFGGLKMVEDDRAAVENGRSKYSTLFLRVQDVVTQLRLATGGPNK